MKTLLHKLSLAWTQRNHRLRPTSHGMKKALFSFVVFFCIPLFSGALVSNDYAPGTVGAGSPEVHIKPDGTILVRSGRIDLIAGNTFYLGTQWGPLQMRFTLKTDAKTTVTKRYGGSTTVSQIRIGDYVDVEGDFFSGSDFFGVQGLRIKDWSLQEETGTYSGVILDVQNSSFTLKTPQNQTITVQLATSSAITIKKGTIDISFDRLRKGDAIPRVFGVYNYAKNILTADTIAVTQGKTEFLPRNFEGILKQLVTPTVPATIIVTVKGNDYTVKISDKTSILKKDKSTAQLARFVPGDTIRFYGAVREEEKTLTDALVVDAEVIRNLSL